MTDIQSALREQLDKYVTMFNSGDSSGLQDMYNENCRLLSPNAKIVEGKKHVKKVFEELFASGLVRVECTRLEPQAMGPDFAFTCSKWVNYNTDRQIVAVIKDLVIWKRVEGTWKMYRDIFNSN